LARCEHGVYIAANDDVAWYCQSCNPWLMTEGIPFEHRDFHLPGNGHHAAIEERARPKANSRGRGSCPDCGSWIYEQLTETKRRCGDCGTEFGGKAVRVRQQAEEVSTCVVD